MTVGHHLLAVVAISAARVNADCINPRDDSDGQPLCRTLDSNEDGSRKLGGLATPPQGMKLAVIVRPEWVMWSGLDFANGFVEGTFGVQEIWRTSVGKYFAPADAASVVRIRNFYGGASSILWQPIGTITRSDGNISIHQTMRQFVGKFKQAFDPTCYPFDHQTASFEIVVDMPMSMFFDMVLVCQPGEIARDSDGNVVEGCCKGIPTQWTTVKTCTKKQAAAVGFLWDDLVCTKHSGSLIKCEMTGHRELIKMFLNFILPSMLVASMSFISFQLDISMSMPRIATTMIAMLTLINLTVGVSKGLPGSGPVSWIEKDSVIGMSFMFFNLCCHIGAMRAAKKGYPVLSDCIDDIGCGISFCLYLIMPFALIKTSECEGKVISSGQASAAIAFGTLLLIAMLAKAYLTHRKDFAAWLRPVKAQAEASSPLPPEAPNVQPVKADPEASVQPVRADPEVNLGLSQETPGVQSKYRDSI